jgi:hypothetical protein
MSSGQKDRRGNIENSIQDNKYLLPDNLAYANTPTSRVDRRTFVRGAAASIGALAAGIGPLVIPRVAQGRSRH